MYYTDQFYAITLSLSVVRRVVNSKDEEVELHSSVECKVLMPQHS